MSERTHYVEPDTMTVIGRVLRTGLGKSAPNPNACMTCSEPREAHRSRHSADPERRNRCPKPVT